MTARDNEHPGYDVVQSTPYSCCVFSFIDQLCVTMEK